MRALALADPGATARIVDALRFLHDNAFHPGAEETGNWWHWEIGTPRILLDVCVLLRTQLPEADLTRYLAAVRRFCPDPDHRTKTGPWSPLTETGANRADKALIVALAGLLAGDGDPLHGRVLADGRPVPAAGDDGRHAAARGRRTRLGPRHRRDHGAEPGRRRDAVAITKIS